MLNKDCIRSINLGLKLLTTFFRQRLDTIGQGFIFARADHSDPDAFVLELLGAFHMRGNHANGTNDTHPISVHSPSRRPKPVRCTVHAATGERGHRLDFVIDRTNQGRHIRHAVSTATR